jgi:phage-related minor tail protein
MGSKSLRGLTIEIGGDTTELNKALDSVDKRTKSLSSELREIDAALKLDPTNTELVAQKQKVLASAIESTEDKLRVLKDAEKQAQKQFERGEISQEQYRALRREIIATESKLNKYKQEVDRTSDKLEEHSDNAKKAARSTDDFGDKSKEAEQSAGKLGGVLGTVAKTGFAAVVAAAGAAVAGLTAAAESTRDYRAEMGKLTTGFDASGHSAETATETYKTLQGVIGETDQSVEAAQQIALLANSEEDAAKWAGLAAGVVGRFGDALQPETFYEAANETLKLGEATGGYTQMLEQAGYDVEKFNKGLAKCKTEGDKQAYMLKVTEELLGDAADKYRETNGEIIRANEANEEWQESLAGVGGAVEPILTDVKMMGASLVSDLVPGVQAAMEAFRGVLNGEEGASDALGEALTGLISDALNKVVELAPTLVKVAVSLVKSLASTLGAQLPVVLDVLFNEVLPELLTGVGELAEILVTALPGLIESISSALPGLVTMLTDAAVGLILVLCENLPSIIQPLIDNLPSILESVISAVLSNLPVLVEGLLSLVTALVPMIPDLLNLLLDSIFFTFAEQYTTMLMDLIPPLLVGLGKLIWEICKALPGLLLALVKVVFGMFVMCYTAITTAFKHLPEWFEETFGIAWEKVKEVFSREKIRAFFSSIWESIKGAFGKVTDWFRSTFSKAWTAVKNVFSTGGKIFDGIKAGISSVFKNVVNSLIRGINKVIAVPFKAINGMLNTIRTKDILGIQPFLNLWKHNPLTVPAIPELAQGGVLKKGQVGLLEGDGAEAVVPLERNTEWIQKVAEKLSGFMLDGMRGIQLERSLMSRATTQAPAVALVEGMTSKMDSILAAIEKGHILVLDGDAIVGATAAKMDNALGRRRTLASRGAI